MYPDFAFSKLGNVYGFCCEVGGCCEHWCSYTVYDFGYLILEFDHFWEGLEFYGFCLGAHFVFPQVSYSITIIYSYGITISVVLE